jgi:hypothetical protein
MDAWIWIPASGGMICPIENRLPQMALDLLIDVTGSGEATTTKSSGEIKTDAGVIELRNAASIPGRAAGCPDGCPTDPDERR